MAITTRIGKGSELTYTEMDDNLKQIPNGSDSSITDTGINVGIGISSPSAKLDVVGNIKVSGGLYVGGTGSANYLDDYEEGTWTPSLYGGGNTASSYTQQAGRYVKIGSMVTVYFNLRVSDFGSVSSGLFVSGLPYTATQYSNPYPQGVLDVLNSAINLDDGQCIQISTDKLTLLENLGKTTSHTNINRNDIDVGTTMRGQIQYFTH